MTYVLLALCLALAGWVYQQGRRPAAHQRHLTAHDTSLDANRATLDSHQRHLGLQQRCIEAHRDQHERARDTGSAS